MLRKGMKISVVVIASVMLSLGLGIGALAARPFEGITIRAAMIGGGNYEKLYEEFIPKWEEETGGKVIIVAKMSHFELDKKYKLDFAAGAIDYDIMTNHTSFAAAYNKFGVLLDLAPYYTPEELVDFPSGILDMCRIGGRLVQMPRHIDISNIYYRADLFNDPENKSAFKAKYGYELRPPDTWDEVYDMAEFLNNPPGVYGTQYTGKEEAFSGRFYEMLLSNGGALFDPAWKPVFNSPIGVKTLNYFKKLYQNGLVPPGVVNYVWDDVAKNFATGKIAFHLDWGGWYPWYRDPKASKIAEVFDYAPMPKGDSGIRVHWSGCHSFSVVDTSKNKEAAVSLVKYLTSKETGIYEAELGFGAVRTSVWDYSIKSTTEPRKRHFYEVYKYCLAKNRVVTPPLIPEWPAFSNILFPELQAAVLEEKPVKKALDDAARKTEEMMRKAGYYR